MTSENCPSPDLLQHFLLGLLPRAVRGSIEEHILACDDCVSMAGKITADDYLTQLATQSASLSDHDTEALQHLIERLKAQKRGAETLRLEETLVVPVTGGETAFETDIPPAVADLLAPPEEPDELGRLGDYRVLNVLGVGGMGIVFKAEDIRLKRIVALKTMKASISFDRDARARFLREAKATAALEHDHVVPIYQVGEERGVPFIAMQYLKGESLGKRLSRVQRLAVTEVARLGKEIATALACAHEADMIHRDIKPDNIWLDEKTDRVKVLDFGLVSAAKDDDGLTHSGTVLGTPKYMAPEQAMALTMDHRADLFSLGSVLYHCAAGCPPFVGNNFTATLIAVVNQAPIPLEVAAPELPPDLSEFITSLLQKDPARRPQTAIQVARRFAELEQDLSRISAQESSHTAEELCLQSRTSSSDYQSEKTEICRPPETAGAMLPPQVPPKTRHRFWAGAAGAGLFFLLGILVITIRHKDGTKTRVRVPQGIDVAVDINPGSQLEIGEETSGDGKNQEVSDASPAMELPSNGNAVSPAPANPQVTIDWRSERAVAESIARGMSGGAFVVVDPQGRRHSIDAEHRELPEGQFFIESVIQVPEINEEILSQLSSCSSLSELHLAKDSPVTLAALRWLSSAPRLEVLSLNDCANAEGHILDLICGCPHLKRVVFTGHNLGVPSATTAPVHHQLQALELHHTDLSTKSIETIVSVFPALADLDLAAAHVAEPSDLKLLAGLSNLRKLSWSADQAGASAIENLRSVPVLHEIVLQSPVSELSAALKRLQPLSLQLTHLAVEVTPSEESVSVAVGYEAIAELKRLETIVLRGHRGSPANHQLQTIARLPELKSLSLDFDESPRKYDMYGVAGCKQARPDIEVVVDGVAYRGAPLTAVTPRSATGPSIDFEAERRIAERLCRLRKGKFILGNQQLKAIGTLNFEQPPLEPFCLLEAQLEGADLSDDELQAIKGSKTLRILRIADNPRLTADSLKRLGALPALTKLEVSNTAIGDGVFPSLNGFPGLEELDLSDSSLTANGLNVLPSLRNLKRLKLSCPITATHVQQIVQQCPRLSDLRISLSEAGDISSLTHLRWLTTLGINGHGLKGAGAELLCQIPSLEELTIQEPGPEELRLLEQCGRRLLKLQLEASSVNPRLSPDNDAWSTLKNLTGLQSLTITGNIAVNGSLLQQFVDIRGLRSFHLSHQNDEPGNTNLRQFSADDVLRFRQQRPDLNLNISGKNNGGMDDWPGRFEGSTSITDWNLAADTPQPAIAPTSAEEMFQLQTAWAKQLGQPVESRNSIGMTLRWIPPGDFFRDPDVSVSPTARRTLHRISRPFEISATEVTVEQFEAFTGATNYRTFAERFGWAWCFHEGKWGPRSQVTWKTPGYHLAPELPVTVLTAEDALAFCAWLSKKEGREYTLPTRDEWEFAARAGGDQRFGWCKPENVLACDWFSDNLPGNSLGPQPVTSKPANPFGLHGVLANVFEYVDEGAAGVFRVGNSWGVHSAGGSSGLSSPGLSIIAPSADVGFRVVRRSPAVRESLTSSELVRRNGPLSPKSIVQRPEPVPGIRSWTIEIPQIPGGTPIIRWSPAGDIVATSGDGGHLIGLWHRDGKLHSLLTGSAGYVRDISFSPDGRRIAAGCAGLETPHHNQVRIWDIATGKCETIVTFPNWIWGVHWAPNGQWIIASVAAGECLIINVESHEKNTIPLPNSSNVTAGQLVFNAQKDQAFVVAGDGSISQIEVPSGKVIATQAVESPPNKEPAADLIAVSPDGTRLAGATKAGKLRIWETATGKLAKQVELGIGPVSQVHWTNDGRFVVVSGRNEKNLQIRLFDIINDRTSNMAVANGVDSIAVSPDGHEIVTAVHGGLQFVDRDSGNVIRRGEVRGVDAYGHERLQLLDGSQLQHRNRVFDMQSGVLVAEETKSPGPLLVAAPDGSWKAFAINGHQLQIVPREFDRNSIVLTPMKMSPVWRSHPRGKLIAHADDNTIQIWDPLNGYRTVRLVHPAAVWTLEWSSDGQRIASMASDQVLRIWDVSKGEVIGEYSNWPGRLAPYVNIWSGSRWMSWVDGPQESILLPFTHQLLSQPLMPKDAPPRILMPNYRYQNLVDAIIPSPNQQRTYVWEGFGSSHIVSRRNNSRPIGNGLGWDAVWHSDSQRIMASEWGRIRAYDVPRELWLGSLWPELEDGKWLVIGPTGHYQGSEGVARHLVYVAQLDDGSIATFSPDEFARRFRWKNDTARATLMGAPE